MRRPGIAERQASRGLSSVMFGLAAASFAILVTIAEIGRPRLVQHGALWWALACSVIAIPASLVGALAFLTPARSAKGDAAVAARGLLLGLSVVTTAAASVCLVAEMSRALAVVLAVALVLALEALRRILNGLHR